MKIRMEPVKKYIQQHGGFSMVLVLEMLFLVILGTISLRKPVTYELNSENLIVRDSMVEMDAEGVFSITGKSDEEAFSRWIIGSDVLYMPWGVYEVEAEYHSKFDDMDDRGDSYGYRAGMIQLISENHASGIRYNDINNISLMDGRTSTADRIWIRSITGVDDVQVMVCFFGVGELQLKSIVIRELPVWRLFCLIGWLLAFVAVDVLYTYLFMDNSYKNKTVVIGLLATVIFSSLPLFTDFVFYGHDLEFHLARIWSLAEGIRRGHWILPIQTELFNGYGYAAPLFYGQIFLYIPAVLYNMAVPLQVCYQVYVFLVNAATCLICYYCIRDLLKDKNLAVLGAFLYTLSAYRISNVYVRAAAGEYTAMVFFPLVLYGFVKVYMEEGKRIWKGVLPIVMGLSGVIQSHLLSCETTAFCIIILCIIRIRKTLQPERLLALASAASLTVVVNLSYIVPFLQSMQMDIAIKDRSHRIQGSGAYLLQVLGVFMTSAGADEPGGMHHEMPLAIGFSLVAGLLFFLLCCAKKYDWGISGNQYLQIGTVCSGFTILCIILSTGFFPWDSISDINAGLSKVFSMVQFPWRYLSIGTVTCLMAAVISVKLLGECKGVAYRNVAAGIMVAFTVLNIGHFYTEYGDEVPAVKAYGVLGYDADYRGAGDYLPTGTAVMDLNWKKIVMDETCVTVDHYSCVDGITEFWCENASDEEQSVEIPLLNYDNYHAYAMDDQTELEIRNGGNNYVRVVVPPGYEGNIQVLYKIPLLWKLSYIVSAIAVISIFMFGIIGRKQKERNLQKR